MFGPCGWFSFYSFLVGIKVRTFRRLDEGFGVSGILALRFKFSDFRVSSSSQAWGVGVCAFQSLGVQVTRVQGFMTFQRVLSLRRCLDSPLRPPPPLVPGITIKRSSRVSI